MPFFGKSTSDDEALAHQLSEQVTLLARNDPQFAALLAQGSEGQSPLARVMGSASNPAIRAYLAQHGIQIPEGFSIRPHSAGGQSVVQIGAPEHMPTAAYALTAGIPAAAAVIPALMGGGAAGSAAGGGGAAGSLPAHLGGAGAAAGAGGGILDTILKYAPVGAGLVQHLASGNGPGGGSGMAGQAPPELSELLKMSMDRMREQEPLFQSVTRQALAGLPTYAQGK